MRRVLLLLSAATLCAQSVPSSEQLRRARELLVAGKPEDAIPIYQELVRTVPNNPELLTNLCIAEFKAKRYRDAIEQAQAALRLQPDLPSANLFLGASYVELGESAAAIPPLNKVLGTQPNDRSFFDVMVERQTEASQRAVQNQAAQSLRPLVTGRHRHRDLGRVYTQIDDYRSAHVAFDRSLALEQQESLTYLYLGELYEKEGNLGSAAGA